MDTSKYSTISFPALGLELDPPRGFQLFGFDIRFYGIIIAVGLLLAVIYGLKRSKQFGLKEDDILDGVLGIVPLSIICARLYYCAFSWDTFKNDPISILYIWQGGIAIYGAVIGAVLGVALLCLIKKLRLGAVLDIMALGFLIGQSVGRWGNFFNQEAFGGNTTLPWGMSGDIIRSGPNGSGYVYDLPVHPTFLYESLWCALGFVLLHLWFKKAYRFKGQIFCGYAVWYGLGRFFIESLRTDSLMTGSMRVSQLVAVLAVIGGIILFFILRRMAIALPRTLEITPEDDLQLEAYTPDESTDTQTAADAVKETEDGTAN